MPSTSRSVAARAVAVCLLSLLPGALAAAAQSEPFEPVTNEMLLNPDPADWLHWRRTLDGWGFRLGTWGNLLETQAVRSLSTHSFPSFPPSF